jgi:putative ABC transport system permease protein
VVPASRWSAVASDQQDEQNQVGLELLLGIAIAYCAIGIASTSLMSASGRRGELALLRLTGATRRQIAWIVAAESLALTFAAVAVAAAISGLVLGGLWVAFARAAGFTPIVLPWPLIGMITGASALIGVVASTLPAIIWPAGRPRPHRPGEPGKETVHGARCRC